MLVAVGTPQPIQAAAGQYVRASCQFQSTTALTGNSVKFNPGFTSSQNAPAGATAWSIAYPAVAGTYPMTFNAPAIWKNYDAELEVIDSTNFRLSLSFFVGSGAGYVGSATAPDNSNPFGSALSAVTFHAQALGDEAYCTIPVQATSFCAGGGMTITVDYTNGTVIELASSSSMFSAPYLGFYRVDALSGVLSMPDDTLLNYAQLGIGVQSVPPFPSSCFSASTPFIGTPGGSLGESATVTIDPSCIVLGGQYRFYIVYNDGTAWRSCQSAIIEANSNEPVITGEASYSISDGTSIFTTGCLTGVPPCKNLEATVKMDKATYDVALLAAGITGAQEDYFTGVKVALQSTFNGAVTGALRLAQAQVVADGVTGTFTYSADPGNRYIVFVFTYTFANRVDTVLIPVQITTVDYFVLTPPDQICAEDTGDLTFTLPETVGTTFTTQYDTPGRYEAATGITVAGSTVTIDRASLPIGTARCYEICSENITPIEQPCMCDCGCITFRYTGEACNDLAYMGEIVAQGVLASDIRYFRIETDDGSNIQLNSNTATINGTAVERFPITFFLRGELALNNGCVYTIPAVNFQLSPNGSGLEPCTNTEIREVCQANCDCDEVPPATGSCSNLIAITDQCLGGRLSFTHTEQFNSPVGSDTIECSLDGNTWGACDADYGESEVHARRTVTFTDGCPDIQAAIIGRCTPDVNCVNSATVGIEKTDTLLTLTMNGLYNSAGASETIYYSINGGASYLPYLSPVTLTGDEEIRVYSLTTFTDGCPDVITPVRDATGTPLNSEPFVTYCDVDGNVTGFALAVVDENGSRTIYYDANMVQRETVPPGGPCETFTPCATCP